MTRLYAPDIEAIIIKGMARGMFASVWADWQDHYGRTVGMGEDAYYSAPETPQYVLDEARKRAGNVEMLNGRGDMPEALFMLVRRAAEADVVAKLGPIQRNDEKFEPKEPWKSAIETLVQDPEYLESFGHYIAMQIMGHGVGWFDNHAKFDLKLPYRDYTYFDLDDEHYPIPEESEEA